MLTDDLTATFTRHAAEAPQPAAELLARVERQVDRRHRMHIAAVSCIALVLLAGLGTGITLTSRPDGNRAAPTATLGSVPCDDPAGAPPANYIDWPCPAAADAQTDDRVATISADVLRMYHLTAGQLKVRLLTDAGPADTVAEVWRADVSAPAVVVDLSPGGVEFNATPPGDPALILEGTAGGTQRRVFTRPDVATVILERRDGTTTVTPVGGVATLRYPQTSRIRQPDWHVVAITASGQRRANVPWDIAQSSPDPAFTAVARNLCEDPASEGQQVSLDWPCAAPADGKTQQRVNTIIAGLAKSYDSIRTPHLRLLADTLDDGEPKQGPAVTEIEIWDNTDPRSAVLAGYIESDDQSLSVAAFSISRNDPSIVVSSTFHESAGLVFVRAGIAAVAFDHGGIVEHAQVHGGVAVIHVPGVEDFAESSTWRVTGFDTAGRQVASAPFDIGGCTKTQATPCDPLATPGPPSNAPTP